MIKIAEKTRFDWLLAGKRPRIGEIWNTELLASESFAVVPSLGALVPGWLLIVPRRPMLSLRELSASEQDELSLLIEKAAVALRVFDGRIFAFEHGSSHDGSLAGCGVDQAHLHLVPLNFDLLASVSSKQSRGVIWHTYGKLLLTDLPSEGEYIAVWRVEDGRGAVAHVQEPVSQWMRRAIASELGMGEDWDYRTKHQLENIRATVARIQGTIS